MKSNFADMIISLMQEHNISQTELSQISGITQSSISDWICGKYLPKKDKIEILAKVFKVSPSYLMGWQDDRVSDSSANKLYENIRNRRIELGLTQDELAKKVGYSDRSMIAKIESGIVDISKNKIMQFAQALDTTSYHLMGLESDQMPFYSENKSINSFSKNTLKIIDLVNQLNSVGVAKTLDILEDLVSIPKYKKQ